MKKNNKVLILLVIALIIVLDIIVVKIATKKNNGNNTVKEKPFDICQTQISEMKSHLWDDNYIKYLGIPEDIAYVVRDIKDMNYDKIKACYRITNLYDVYSFALYSNDVNENDFKGDIKTLAYNKYALNYANVINSDKSGVVALSVGNILAWEKSILYPQLSEAQVYIVDYDNAYPIMVSLVPEGDGIVRVRCTYLIVGNFVDVDIEGISREISFATYNLELEQIY